MPFFLVNILGLEAIWLFSINIAFMFTFWPTRNLDRSKVQSSSSVVDASTYAEIPFIKHSIVGVKGS